jgi:hypothetical protein
MSRRQSSGWPAVLICKPGFPPAVSEFDVIDRRLGLQLCEPLSLTGEDIDQILVLFGLRSILRKIFDSCVAPRI